MRPPTSKFKIPTTLDDALSEIRTFWTGPGPFGRGSPALVPRLEGLFGRHMPTPLAQYLSTLLPEEEVALQRVGNPISFWPERAITPDPVGYRIDGKGQPIPEWSRSWLIFADEGADPVIVDLESATDTECPVLQAMHGAGEWDFGEVADSMPQYLLLSAAVHHALTMVPEPTLDGEDRFELVEPAASWLFPRVRGWAGGYYEDWASVFSNS